MTVANVTKREVCAYCADDGFVVVDTGDPVDEQWAQVVRGLTYEERRARGLHRLHYGDVMAPCPYCELGKLTEFPGPDPKTGAARKGNWGVDGYWQGREPDVTPVETSRALPKEESAERMRALMERAGRPRADTADAVNKLIASLEKCERGRCEDCGETVRERFRYGRFTLCRACVVPRARARVDLGVSREGALVELFSETGAA